MANTTVTQVNAALFSILQSLQGSGNPLNDVYNYPNPVVESFPSAIMKYVGESTSQEDTIYDITTMEFLVTLVFHDTNDNDGYNNQLTTLDSIKAEFAKDDHYTLGGIVKRMKPISQITRTKTSISNTDLVLFDMSIECELLIDTSL